MAPPSLSEPGPCTRPGRVAAIVVGLVSLDVQRTAPRVDTAFAGHLAKLVKATLEPTDADAFTVYELEPRCCRLEASTGQSSCSPVSCQRAMDAALLRMMRPRLRAIAAVTPQLPRGTPSAASLDAGAGRPNVTKHVLAHGRKYGRSLALQQWYKVQESWRLMVAHEARAGAQYDAVLKLRFDTLTLPGWQLCRERDGLAPSAPRMLHAMTDMVFWGRRDVMEVACGLYGKHVLYEAAPGASAAARQQRDALLPIAVRAHLSSLLAQPPEAFTYPVFYYPKLVHLFVPEMGGEDAHATTPGARPVGLVAARRGMCQNLLRALAAGWERIDPLAPRPHQPAVRSHEALLGKPGARGWADGRFHSEHHFLHWMFSHNVTVCDLGAGVTRVAKLGSNRAWPRRRPGRDECLGALDALPPPRAGGPSEHSAATIGDEMRRRGIREEELCGATPAAPPSR